jgi:hypothetical protein
LNEAEIASIWESPIMVDFAGKTLSEEQVLSDCGFVKFSAGTKAETEHFLDGGGLPLDKCNSKAIYLGANVHGFLQ